MLIQMHVNVKLKPQIGLRHGVSYIRFQKELQHTFPVRYKLILMLKVMLISLGAQILYAKNV